jgi:hypothetical protein
MNTRIINHIMSRCIAGVYMQQILHLTLVNQRCILSVFYVEVICEASSFFFLRIMQIRSWTVGMDCAKYL